MAELLNSVIFVHAATWVPLMDDKQWFPELVEPKTSSWWCLFLSHLLLVIWWLLQTWTRLLVQQFFVYPIIHDQICNTLPWINFDIPTKTLFWFFLFERFVFIGNNWLWRKHLSRIVVGKIWSLWWIQTLGVVLEQIFNFLFFFLKKVG